MADNMIKYLLINLNNEKYVNKRKEFSFLLLNYLLKCSENNIEYHNYSFRYSGEYTDDETGFQYLRARYYNPNIRRFITKDTYKGEITNPLSLVIRVGMNQFQ